MKYFRVTYQVLELEGVVYTTILFISLICFSLLSIKNAHINVDTFILFKGLAIQRKTRIITSGSCER